MFDKSPLSNFMVLELITRLSIIPIIGNGKFQRKYYHKILVLLYLILCKVLTL